jgi:hypothetical protein
VSWTLITEDWRVKLLALGLAFVMLGAVALSQNPPTSGTVKVPVTYSVGANVVLINPPASVPVTYNGLADVIKNVSASNLVANVDATHVKPGPAVKVSVVAKSTITTGIVNIVQPAPINVKVDARTGVDLPVAVVAQPLPGWSIDSTKTYASCPGAQKPNPCTVHFDGPASWEKGLVAYVTYPNAVGLTKIEAPSYPILLRNDNGVLDLGDIPTTPTSGLDIATASMHIEAVAGSTSVTVPLLAGQWSHGPAPGYRVSDDPVSPNPVVVSGDPVTLGRIHNIQLPPVDLTGKTSDATFQVQITYPPGTSGTVQTATVKYVIVPNPGVSPSP